MGSARLGSEYFPKESDDEKARMVCYLCAWMLAAGLTFEAHARLQQAKEQQETFKQEQKRMIYVFPSAH